MAVVLSLPFLLGQDRRSRTLASLVLAVLAFALIALVLLAYGVMLGAIAASQPVNGELLAPFRWDALGPIG